MSARGERAPNPVRAPPVPLLSVGAFQRVLQREQIQDWNHTSFRSLEDYSGRGPNPRAIPRAPCVPSVSARLNVRATHTTYSV